MRVPGFADTAPDCAGAQPTFWQELACPYECDQYCEQECTVPGSPRCRKCREDCLDECYFVPCCDRFQRCEKGVVEIRTDCYPEYQQQRDKSPEQTPWTATDRFCRQ